MTCTRRLTGAIVVLLAASGCVTRSAEMESSPASGEPLTEQEAPSPSAADGVDATACADGNCEILLEEKTTIPVPGGTLTLTLVGDDRVEYEVSIKGSNGSGSAEGNCVSTFTLDGTGSGSTCFAGGPPPEPNPGPGEMAMVVTGQDTGTPVLLLATG